MTGIQLDTHVSNRAKEMTLEKEEVLMYFRHCNKTGKIASYGAGDPQQMISMLAEHLKDNKTMRDIIFKATKKCLIEIKKGQHEEIRQAKMN